MPCWGQSPRGRAPPGRAQHLTSSLSLATPVTNSGSFLVLCCPSQERRTMAPRCPRVNTGPGTQQVRSEQTGGLPLQTCSAMNQMCSNQLDSTLGSSEDEQSWRHPRIRALVSTQPLGASQLPLGRPASPRVPGSVTMGSTRHSVPDMLGTPGDRGWLLSSDQMYSRKQRFRDPLAFPPQPRCSELVPGIKDS